jgi:hypothetical protein
MREPSKPVYLETFKPSEPPSLYTAKLRGWIQYRPILQSTHLLHYCTQGHVSLIDTVLVDQTTSGYP